MILDGRKTADILNERLLEKVLKLKSKPHLEIILIGNNPASHSYVKSKLKTVNKVGMSININYLEEDISEDYVYNLIDKYNQDPKVNGILLQLPIPKHLNEDRLIESISFLKDVDGFHTMNRGLLFQNKNGTRPATPLGIIMLLKHYNIEVSGKDVLVIGRSQIVGTPMSKMMLDLNATVTTAHSKTKDLDFYTKHADIIIVAAGKPNLLTKEMIKEGAIIIDVGINRFNGKLVGDVDFINVKDKASFITPVPGGVGPMTICALSYNLYDLYLKQER
ncbi:MAG: tetrahydrofolate dehydrogenase/cyclohydrolase catalytic domain-containing protein [Acholeplasmataceae bacterium]